MFFTKKIKNVLFQYTNNIQNANFSQTARTIVILDLQVFFETIYNDKDYL